MSLLEISRDAGVLRVVLNDVRRRNALSADMLHELIDALDAAEADEDARVLVLSNRGSTFCAGADLREQSSAPRAIGLDELLGRLRASRLVSVGRLDGHCVAGGVGLAAALDIAIAREDATFGFSEVRLGLAPAIISVVCLPKMREADARAAMLRGNRFDATEAARIGLISAAVPAQRLDEAVDEVLADLLAGEPHSLALTKQLIARVPSMSLEEAFAWTRTLSGELFASPAAREGMSAFLEKRAPSWAPSQPD